MLIHRNWPSKLSTYGSHGTKSKPCCEFSPLWQPQMVLLCYCVWLRFCMCQVVCTECVLSRDQYTSSSTEAAVQREPCFMLLPLCQWSLVYVCGWCTTGDRTMTPLSRPMQQHTHRLTSCRVYEAYSSNKSTSSYRSLERLFCPFSTCEAPRISSQPHPEREPCTKYEMQ